VVSDRPLPKRTTSIALDEDTRRDLEDARVRLSNGVQQVSLAAVARAAMKAGLPLILGGGLPKPTRAV
jgi:hypothetical protein